MKIIIFISLLPMALWSITEAKDGDRVPPLTANASLSLSTQTKIQSPSSDKEMIRETAVSLSLPATSVTLTEKFTVDSIYLQRYHGYYGRWIVVWRGANVGKIARRYGSSVARIAKANRLGKALKIIQGDHLFVPYSKAQAEKMLKTRTVTVQGKKFIAPAAGIISSPYGVRTWWRGRRRRSRMHNGIDIAAPRGTIIVASKSGTVIYAGRYGRYGRTVIVDHGSGVKTRYAHCSKITVRLGEKVKQGQTIALVGNTGRSTGPHLHFEIRLADAPLNPAKYIDFSGHRGESLSANTRRKKQSAHGPLE